MAAASYIFTDVHESTDAAGVPIADPRVDVIHPYTLPLSRGSFAYPHVLQRYTSHLSS